MNGDSDYGRIQESTFSGLFREIKYTLEQCLVCITACVVFNNGDFQILNGIKSNFEC